MNTKPIFHFIVLDPRKGPEQLPPSTWARTLGVEVTSQALADACGLGNIDPQHGFCRIAYNGADVGSAGPGSPVPIGPEAACTVAAIAAAYPQPGDTLATVRPDPDSIVGMVVLVLKYLRLRNASHDGGGMDDRFLVLDRGPRQARLCLVAERDAFVPGAAWSPRELPTVAKPWPSTMAAASETESLAPLGAICSPGPGQTQRPIAERVAIAACWLLWGRPDGVRGCDAGIEYGWREPAEQDEATEAIYAACGVDLVASAYESSPAACPANQLRIAEMDAQNARVSLAKAVESGEIRIGLLCTCGGWNACSYETHGGYFAREDVMGNQHVDTCDAVKRPIAVVQSAHRGAMGLGYCLAPVVVAVLPYRIGDDTTKATIAWWSGGRVDRDALATALNAAEVEAGGVPEWGGGATILGSPQGHGTKLTVETIAQIVAGHVKD